jgi:hypothetical protein
MTREELIKAKRFGYVHTLGVDATKYVGTRKFVKGPPPTGRIACDLCSTIRLIFRYELEHPDHPQKVWVGSECIKLFVGKEEFKKAEKLKRDELKRQAKAKQQLLDQAEQEQARRAAAAHLEAVRAWAAPVWPELTRLAEVFPLQDLRPGYIKNLGLTAEQYSWMLKKFAELGLHMNVQPYVRPTMVQQ